MKITTISKKLSLVIFAGSLLAITSAPVVSAHVTVKPGEVETASYQTFIVSVPNEKDIPTTVVKVVIPEGVTNITPTQKVGWKISMEKEGNKEIIVWSGNEIPEALRDEFTFSAKTPEKPGELKWKAYQTYSDGTVVSWDKDEQKSSHSSSNTGPFSVTSVVSTHGDNDESTNEKSLTEAQVNADRALYIAVASLIVSFISIFLVTRKK